MEEDAYKDLLFEVLAFVAHSEDADVGRRVLEWLETMQEGAERHGLVALSAAITDTVNHLTLHQARRQLNRLSGRD